MVVCSCKSRDAAQTTVAPPEPLAAPALIVQDVAPPLEPTSAEDPAAAINDALRRSGATGTATIAGVYLSIDGDCSAALLRRIALNPQALALVLRSGVRFARCDGDEHDTRVPLPGSTIPESIDWHRSFVTTPTTMSGAGRPVVHCTATEESDTVSCSRTEAECRAIERNAREITGDSLPCRETRKLWCYDTSGTEIDCAFSRRGCETRKNRIGRGGPCTERWAL